MPPFYLNNSQKNGARLPVKKFSTGPSYLLLNNQFINSKLTSLPL